MGMKFCNTDEITVGDERPVVFWLSHEPMLNSLRVFWGGLAMTPGDFAVSGNVVTFDDPEGRIQTGDKIWAQYAYQE